VTDWPLVGREVELGAVFERLEDDPSAGLVFAGAAGVGKSRLVREIALRVDERGWSTSVVVGIRAAASIPFGAVAPLFSDLVGEESPVEMLTRARRALTATKGEPPHLLIVDDAQRLDLATATLIHQVVAERICRTVATVRTGERAPDPIESLWTAGLVERHELAELSRVQTGELLAAALGGPVDGATRHRLWQASGGNVLYLREVVVGACADGSLTEEGGIWRLRGSACMPPRLVELVERRFDSLDSDARAALEVVAFAERIDLDQVIKLADIEALERLEDEGLVEVVEEGGAPIIVLAHPLYGEAVRATMPQLQRRRVSGAVADAIEAAGMPRPGDVVRVATWRLDAGQPVDANLLTTAAHRAYEANDYSLADRLAAAAREAGGGVRAGLVSAWSAMMTGRDKKAAERLAGLFAGLAAEAITDRERVKVAETEAIVLGLHLGRERDALAVLDEILATVADPELVDPVRGSVAVVLSLSPRPVAAIEAARPVLDRPGSSGFWRATYATSLAMAVCGRLEEAVAVGLRGHEAHARLAVPVRWPPEVQFHGPVLAFLGAGRADEASALVAKGYDAAIAARDPVGQAIFAVFAGSVAVHRGWLTAAGHHFREAATVSREINDTAVLRWALGGAALAAGMRSDRAESTTIVTELDTLEPPPRWLLELDLVERGRAWASAANGATKHAITVLRNAAERAAANNQYVVEALLRHDLVRLGKARAEQPRLAKLANQMDGELVSALAEHAAALVTGVAAPLEAAAHRLADLGAALLAYEAASDAATAWQNEGYRRRAAACEELASRYATECDGARSPAARIEAGLTALTVREQDIAALAGDGLTSREIADKLDLSRRTVENHLQAVYDKLGVSSRRDLAAALNR
jgi:DNA-binding CsgD family transcriptional regulator